MMRCPYVCMYESTVSAKYGGFCLFPSERWQQLSMYQCKSRTWINEKGEGSGYFVEPDLLHHTMSAHCPSSFPPSWPCQMLLCTIPTLFLNGGSSNSRLLGLNTLSSPCRTLVPFCEAPFRLPFCPSFTVLGTAPGLAGDGSKALIFCWIHCFLLK